MASNGVGKIGSFNNFQRAKDKDPFRLKPITTEFSKGSIPDSLSTINRESAWSRWRRGYELATASTYDNDYTYNFQYQIPVPSGTPSSVVNPNPIISGAFVGFPTTNKDLGMHWAGWRYAGSMRSDKLKDPITNQNLYVESITEDSTYWYVKLAGSWSVANPLPPPFYVAVPGVPGGLTPLNSEILEDRVITVGGQIIDKDTIDPTTQKRYGYVQAVLVATNPTTGILTFRKAGSVEVSPDQEYFTPSPAPFKVGRYLITGARFCCSCQDFTHRDYAFTRRLTDGTLKIYPRSSIASVKPGRFEVTTLSGVVDNSAMTSASVNRKMDVYAPSGYSVPFSLSTTTTIDNNAPRDNPGVYREFGATFLRSTTDPSIPGSTAEGMPRYEDYTSTQSTITSITDNWTPLLDEMRYCKHIYALKFKDNTFPPEPSDFPVEEGSIAAWEQKLVEDTENEQKEAKAFLMTRQSLSVMDVPPYNCQGPMMMPMMQKLFNVPAEYIRMQGFTMFDKDGKPYTP
jgi:hypothetical protein